MRNNGHIEDTVYENNLYFYTILKMLVQCRMSNPKMISLQNALHGYHMGQYEIDNIKRTLLDLDVYVSIKSDNWLSYENLINMLDANNKEMWFDMMDVAIDLILYKGLILEEAKAYTNQRQKDFEARTFDKLSLEYDSGNLKLPYGRKVMGSLLVYALTNMDRVNNFILESSGRSIQNINSKLELLANLYHINSNNMMILIVDESVMQSNKSTAGSSYEERVKQMISPLVDDLQGHSHDENIMAMEYDFTFEIDNKRIGVSAKRTLRERYKQNHESVDDLSVDGVMVFTLGTDLNVDKMRSLLQKDKTFIVVAREVYNSRSYLKNNDRVISSADLGREKLRDICTRFSL
ncbi:MAG: hypothetical protein Q4C83_01305 [Candidatus Saccharibacteria bacterium]|nr:hypothetical protein [Candidatus Saccharibacteria bacterium]